MRSPTGRILHSAETAMSQHRDDFEETANLDARLALKEALLRNDGPTAFA